MGCQATTLGAYMAVDKFAESLVDFLEAIDKHRCTTCQSREDFARWINKQDIPTGIGRIYLEWFKGEK